MVGSNAVEPGIKSGRLPEIRQRLIGFYENILSGVFRVRRVPKHGSAKPDDLGLVTPDQFRVSIAATAQNLLDDRDIFVGLLIGSSVRIHKKWYCPEWPG